MRPQLKQIDRAAERLRLGRDAASVRRRVEAMEQLLERAVRIPGTERRVGLDAIVGLVPVLGDAMTAGMGAWIVWEARNLGMSRWRLARMIGNVGFDFAIGAIPLLGEVFDFVFRSNTRNLRHLRRWLDKHHPETGVIEGEVVRRS